ncbi:DUF805 domain-containing protein [Acinetobacter gerneri]|uniref:DUF805 domain-containing protein n=1 Tax=Acinetobacter gerneri TaxID=202952 RepID=UPI0032140E62
MTSFEQQTIHPQDNPLSPKGRFSRLSYLAWMFITGMIYSFALSIVIGIAAVALLTSASFDISTLATTGLGIFAIALFVLVVVIFMIFSICISIRRIHDLNKSGWLWLLFLVPVVNVIFSIYLFVAKGTEGANNYGPLRPTEQTEKILGILYAVMLAIFIVAYGALLAWAISMQNQLPNLQQIGQSSNSTVINSQLENDDPSLENAVIDDAQPADVNHENGGTHQ